MLTVYLEGGEVTLRQAAMPIRPPGYALIRTLVSGVCNTDLELQRGYYGFAGTPGHEFVGEVVEANDPALVGKRVVGEINLACGACALCAIGLGRHCEKRTVLGIVKHPGAFAEYLTLPEVNLHVVPDEISSEEAVFVEPLAAACEILDQVLMAPGEAVAVLGDGKLGLLVAQVLHAHGCRVTLYGRHENKLSLVRKPGLEAIAADKLPHAAYLLVVECTGTAARLREAVSMVRPRGTVVMKSTVHADVAIDSAAVIVNEITLLGSRCGRFEPAIEMLRCGKVSVTGFISAEFSLERASEAFAKAAQRGVLKVLLRND
jgi:alcohol dehydrogenase